MARKKKIYCNKDLLLEICDRDKCIIDVDKIEKYNRSEFHSKGLS